MKPFSLPRPYFDQALADQYIDHNRVTLSEGHCCIRRLAGGGCPRVSFPGGTMACFGAFSYPGANGEPAYFDPWRLLDHGELWLRGRRPFSVTAHLYDLTANEAAELEAAARFFGLTVAIGAGPSWWNPGQCHLVEFRRRPGQ